MGRRPHRPASISTPPRSRARRCTTWWRLCRKVRAEAPDVLLLQWWVPYWTPCLTVISRWIKRNTNIRILFICHNVIPHDGGGTLDRRLVTTVLQQGDAFIVHSEQD